MFGILYFLIFGTKICKHHWNLIDTVKHDDPFDYVGKAYVLQCTECGDLKTRRA